MLRYLTVCISLISKLLFGWLTPILSVGFSRPLEKDGAKNSNFHLLRALTSSLDLYTLPIRRQTHTLTNVIERSFYSRVDPKQRPKGLHFNDELNASTSDQGSSDTRFENEKDLEAEINSDEKRKGGADKTKGKKYDASLVRAIHSAFFWRWWSAGLMKLCAGELIRRVICSTR